MKRLTRAALFFAGAVSASACGNGADEPNNQNTQGDPGEDDDPAGADIYGSPPMEDVDEQEPNTDEPTEEEAMPVEAYGAPPPPEE